MDRQPTIGRDVTADIPPETKTGVLLSEFALLEEAVETLEALRVRLCDGNVPTCGAERVIQDFDNTALREMLINLPPAMAALRMRITVITGDLAAGLIQAEQGPEEVKAERNF